MTLMPIPSADLPVIWWVFWLVVLAIGIFWALAWWITREALGEDRRKMLGEDSHRALGEDGAPPADHGEHDPTQGPSGEGDGDSPGA